MSESTARPWWAVIGPVPTPVPSGIITNPVDQYRRYGGPDVLGPLRLRDGQVHLREHLRMEPQTMDGTFLFASWPVIVEGTSSGDQWPAVVRNAATVLHRVCGLVALAWDEPWQVRTSATNPDNLPPHAPESWPDPNGFDFFPALYEPGDHVEPLPTWIDAAWTRLESDVRLAAAVDSWHEGKLLTPLHPSFALVAFSGAIETASRLAQVEGVQGDGSAAWFWAGVASVVGGEETETLRRRKKAWPKRSGTAHGGALHGIERIFGSEFMLQVNLDLMAQGKLQVKRDPDDELQAFVLDLVPALCRIARTLLLTCLGVTKESR